MKKTLLSLSFLALFGISTNAQTVLFTDSFETYTTAGYIAQQATPAWTTWSNAPGTAEDGVVSEDFANSGIKSGLISGTNDMILPLGNKTSGKFSVSFYYYIPSGFGGYFNLQHFQAPGNQWASEVYFGNGGAGNIVANNVTTNFTHPNDQWIFIENHVDIDNDTAALFIDGTHIVTWPFATQASGGAGAAQLGGVNFYAGAITGQTPKYYMDDVTFTELVLPLTPPTINVDATDIYSNGQAPESFNITNAGQQDMDFIAYPTYPFDVNNIATTPVVTALTHDVSGFTSGLGGFSADITVKAANKFTPSFLESAIGQEITSVDVQINDVATNAALLVYERGSYITPGPGNLLHNIPFNITSAGENVNVALPSALYIDGNDLWIGYVCDADSGTYPLGLDAGPRTSGVNWISTGPGWSEYNATVDANLVINANLQGSPIQKWLTVSPMSGMLTPSQSQQIDLTFNTTGLTPGNYLSVVEIGSNDPNLEYTSVNVHLTVTTGINDNDAKIGVMTYPNPTTENINIKADAKIDVVSIYGMNGQLVKTIQVNANTALVKVNDLAKGNYVLDIKTGNNIIKRNIVVQ
ncbi:MAG: T9SS type A sorting domain-containing protein [Flavobacteriales bacterium]|nr:T9SS type A sorting domain-containing protein [Flavobacteriales bacterium]MCB9364752.1 T9SS type A sorting domain-containing protein [Flavobacteriales bacterium]